MDFSLLPVELASIFRPGNSLHILSSQCLDQGYTAQIKIIIKELQFLQFPSKFARLHNACLMPTVKKL